MRRYVADPEAQVSTLKGLVEKAVAEWLDDEEPLLQEMKRERERRRQRLLKKRLQD
jgi:hypothetical protein